MVVDGGELSLSRASYSPPWCTKLSLTLFEDILQVFYILHEQKLSITQLYVI